MTAELARDFRKRRRALLFLSAKLRGDKEVVLAAVADIYMQFQLLLVLVAGAGASIVSRAVPTNFWLLQIGSEAMDNEVKMCAECCASSCAEELEGSLRALSASQSSKVAVEIEPISLPSDGVPVALEATAPQQQEWSSTEFAEEVTSAGPRSFLLPGMTLARVNEFGFEEGGTGCRVWDASVALSIWASRNAELVRGKRILELGSGVGLSGIAAGLVGADVVFSDVGESAPESLALGGGSATDCTTAALLPNLEANVALNLCRCGRYSGGDMSGDSRAVALDWEACLDAAYEPFGLFDVVLGSDLVYEGFAVTALAAAVAAHTAPGGVAYLMSAKTRFDAAGHVLLERLEAVGGEVELEEMTVHNSFGRVELVLATWRRPSAPTA